MFLIPVVLGEDKPPGKPASPAWLLLCGLNHHNIDSAPGTDPRGCLHRQDGAEVILKGQLGAYTENCSLQRAETNGAIPEA